MPWSHRTAGYRHGVFRVLLTRRWLVWLLVALIASTACVFLGRWQWHRWQERHEMQTTIRTNYDASPIPFEQVRPDPTADVSRSQQWRQVRMVGEYLTEGKTLVRNRPYDGSFGYEIVVPFRTTEGRVVLVDRGWVPNGPTADRPAVEPATPTGKVGITGWIRPAERSLERATIPGQASSINPPQISAANGKPTDNRSYVLLRVEDPRPAQVPAVLPKPDLGTAAGVNLSYAIQWALAAIAFPVLVLLAARRETPGVRARPPKPKKVRIWDEEDG